VPGVELTLSIGATAVPVTVVLSECARFAPSVLPLVKAAVALLDCGLMPPGACDAVKSTVGVALDVSPMVNVGLPLKNPSTEVMLPFKLLIGI
jgi:hypothetical protein